ncbi:MAG: hypothetical protein GF355_07005 [Candidatus Eisenbacteria bacterium]|nr:hypothetical protein [Candidatus Eisenbacteria bacterium]
MRPSRNRIRVMWLLLLAGVCSVQGPVQAVVPAEQNPQYEIPLLQLDRFTVETAETREQARTAADALKSIHGGEWRTLGWDPLTNTPAYIVGTGVETGVALVSDETAAQTGRAALSAAAEALGLDPQDLTLHKVTRGLGKVAVHFQQTYRGLEVWEGKAHATFTESGRLFAMSANFYSDIEVNPTPSLTAIAAEEVARNDLPLDPLTDSVEEGTDLIVLPVPTSPDQVVHHLAWRIRVRTEDPLGIWVTHVDAHSGEILWRYNDIHFENFSGDAFTTPQPETYCDGEDWHPIPHMLVDIEFAGIDYTDADGHWEIAYDGSEPRWMTARFQGPYCFVLNMGGPHAMFYELLTPGVPHAFTWSDDNAQQDERDVFDGVNDIHDFFQSFDPDFSYVNEMVTVRVSIDEHCNAFYDPNDTSINFYRAGLIPGSSCDDSFGADCANTGEIQSIVHHEFGHGIQHRILGWQGSQGLGEGNSDFMANLMTRESILGIGFCQDECGYGMRNSNNSLQYPEDVIDHGVHAAGRVIAGFHWDAMEGLWTLYGTDQGTVASAERWHYGRILEQPTTQPAQVVATFIADDDDGNILNGTPHYDIFCQAARNHGFICWGDVVVDFNHSGWEFGTLDDPYNTLQEGIDEVVPGRRIIIKTGSSGETPTITKELTIEGYDGPVTIGER